MAGMFIMINVVWTCVHAHAWGSPTHWHSQQTNHPPPRGTPKSLKMQCLEQIEIIWFCLKILKSVETPPTYGWVYSLVGWWVGSCQMIMICWDTPTYGWVYGWLGRRVGWLLGSCQITKKQINFDLIKIIQFCLRFMISWDTPTYGWVYGWMARSCQITNNQINPDLIEIIQFCLQIYDLWKYLHAHTTQWSQSLAIEILSIIHSPKCLTFDNCHIMHNCQFWTFRHFNIWILT